MAGHLSNTMQKISISSFRQIPRIIQKMATDLSRKGYPEKDIFGVCLSLEEALVNAVKHGHKGDTRKKVQVRFQVSPVCAFMEVKDQGLGFQPESVPDPLNPDTLQRTSGRGLFLMRHYMNRVRFNPRGNRITLQKFRSQE